MAERKFPDWATDNIADIGNGDPNKADPGAAKQASGWAIEKPLLQTMNWLQNLFGHFIRANNQFKTVVNSYEAEAGERILSDNSSGTTSVLLPVNPIDGQWVEVGSVELYSVNEVTVDGSGNDIMLVGDDSCTLDSPMDKTLFKFWWEESDNMWKINTTGTRGE